MVSELTKELKRKRKEEKEMRSYNRTVSFKDCELTEQLETVADECQSEKTSETKCNALLEKCTVQQEQSQGKKKKTRRGKGRKNKKRIRKEERKQRKRS